MTILHRLFAATVLLLGSIPFAAHADAPPDLIARGQYLTRAADCAACHTTPGGQPFTGGRAFQLPFGVLYAPNITPDETGIANYSDNDWVRMLRRGIGRDGQHLYPAMPYQAYTGLSRDDALAIKAYLMSLPPVHATIPANQISFPFNQRWGMFFWNLVNNPDRRFAPDSSQSTAWNRGAYLVQVLGHCGECHTPRNFMMAVSGRQFAGTQEQGWLAYNITRDPTHGLGNWSDAALTQYLATGHADGHGPASGPMAEVVEYSLRYLTPDDINAIATYLRTVPAQPDGPEAVVAANGAPRIDPNALGARLFAQACEGCHLPSGTGRQSPWAALAGAQSVGDPNGTNITAVLTQGSSIDTKDGTMFMHPFAGGYTDAELAALGNYTIGQFGFRQGNITPQQIKSAK